jgi:hypothetical protein
MNADPQHTAVSVNYYRLLEWFWEEVPYMAGYKSHYGCAFLAIADSINRNSQKEVWRETAVDFVQLINKVSCSKPMYYEALNWLHSHQLITYTAGRNAHSMARFHIGILPIAEVNKRTATSPSAPKAEVNKRTSTDTSKPMVEVNKPTATIPSASTSGLPINKDIPNTYIPTTKEEPVVPTFEEFWRIYDHKIGRKDCQRKWNRLPPKDKLEIMKVLPAYVQATPEGGYPSRKNPLTFLNAESWRDEDIGKTWARNGYPLTGTPSISKAPRPTQQNVNIR